MKPVSSTPCHEACGHLLHSLTCPSSGNAQHLKSRHPSVSAAQQLNSLSDKSNRSAALLADHQRNTKWLENTTRLHTFNTGTHHLGMPLPRTVWVWLNCFLIGVGRFRSFSHKCVMAPSATFECDAEEQTVDHILLQCPIHRPSLGLLGLTFLDDETIDWLHSTCS